MLGLNALLCAIIEEIFKALVRKRFDHERYCNLMGYICQKGEILLLPLAKGGWEGFYKTVSNS